MHHAPHPAAFDAPWFTMLSLDQEIALMDRLVLMNADEAPIVSPSISPKSSEKT